MTKFKWLIVTIMITMVTLFTSAVAWFQISNINIIDNITLGVGLGDHLEISLDGIHYSKSIDKDLLDIKLKDLRFKDITTNDGINFNRGPNYGNQKALVNIDYLSFDIWFRVIPEIGVDDDDVFSSIYLINNKLDVDYNTAKQEELEGTFISSKGRTWKADYTFDNGNEIIEEGSINKYYAKDAMRIGFASNTNNFIFDVSEDESRGYGKPFGQFSYYNQKNDLNKLQVPNEIPETIYELSELEFEYAGIMNNENSLITKLEKKGQYFIGMATLNVWIEGWDADAFDAIRKDQMLIQLEFMAAL